MATEMQLGEVTVDVVFKDIKNVHLSVHPPTGRVTISAPSRMSFENVRLFAISKLTWIKKQQKKFQDQEREAPREYLERESHYLWGKRHLLRIEPTIRERGVRTEHRLLVLRVPKECSEAERAEVIDLWYRAQLKRAAAPLIAKWEKQLGVSVRRWFVQKMKTKWGGSSPERRTIRLNLELAKKPPECLDYIILHELVHFLEPSHSERFRALMDAYMPHWKSVRQALNEAPLSHAEWEY